MSYHGNRQYDPTAPGMQTMPCVTCGSTPLVPNQQALPVLPVGMPTLPTGMPTGPTPTPLTSVNQIGTSAGQMMAAPPGEQAPQTLQSLLYTPGFLRSQIGRRMRVEFLIGTNGPLIDRIGTLVGVGASYILLRPVDSDDLLLCDIYSIKFVTIYF